MSVIAPELFTIATLTGHAIRAMGPNYSVSTIETQHFSRFSTVFHMQRLNKASIYKKKSELLVYRSLWIMDQPIATKMLLTGKKVKGKKRKFFGYPDHLQQF